VFALQNLWLKKFDMPIESDYTCIEGLFYLSGISCGKNFETFLVPESKGHCFPNAINSVSVNSISPSNLHKRGQFLAIHMATLRETDDRFFSRSDSAKIN
jgi:hypothetical protein